MRGRFRVKCPNCRSIQDINGPVMCKCGAQITPQQGELRLYRMGNFLGAAGGFGVYINGEKFGYIGNRETVAYSLPFGEYNIHIAVGMNRKCTDVLVRLTPQMPNAYLKVHMIPGFFQNKFILEPSTPDQMPDIKF